MVMYYYLTHLTELFYKEKQKKSAQRKIKQKRNILITASEAKSIGELRDIVLRVEDKINSLKEVW